MFTEKDVVQIQGVLKDINPDMYRIVLPEFRNGQIIGSKTYGALPISEVQKIAAIKNIPYVETGNLQSIIATKPEPGGGPGSHNTNTSGSPADMAKRIKKVENILRNLDKSQYVLIY